MKILTLTLKKQWFDMILSGEKKAEYRELKPYWDARLFSHEESDRESGYRMLWCRDFDVVRFTNGYGRNAPTMDVKCEGVAIENNGNHDWGFRGKCYVIHLGEILSTANIKPTTQP